MSTWGTTSAAPAPRAGTVEVLVGLLAELDEATESGVFYDRVCQAVVTLTSMKRAVLLLHDETYRSVIPVGSCGVADERLRGHFLAAESDEGARAYARYNAALELAYGAATASGDSCAEAAALAKEAASARGDLVAVAAREVAVATLPSSVCPANAPVVLAAR